MTSLMFWLWPPICLVLFPILGPFQSLLQIFAGLIPVLIETAIISIEK